MAWNPEKYRDKREKVLGIRRRGVSFSTLAALFSGLIVAGFAVVFVPGAVSYMKTRHLDDAIYKLEEKQVWPQAIVEELSSLSGVMTVETDNGGLRLVVTYDRRHTDSEVISAHFAGKGMNASLLNHIHHRQHQHTLETEKEMRH